MILCQIIVVPKTIKKKSLLTRLTHAPTDRAPLSSHNNIIRVIVGPNTSAYTRPSFDFDAAVGLPLPLPPPPDLPSTIPKVEPTPQPSGITA